MDNEINLGDLSKIEIDDELVTCYCYNGEIILGNTLWQVSGISKITDVVKVCRFGSSITRNYFNNITGKSKNGDYYYSVNPLHIQEVKDRALKKLDDSKQDFIKSEKLKSDSKSIADILTWTNDSSLEVVVELSKRLTPDQIQTLKGWLGLVD